VGAPNGKAEPRLLNDELIDSEVPAAVVCAQCGDADCPGCLEEQTRSGVVAVVPWERPGLPAFERLWGTARATTLDGQRFFESLPDGAIASALRFAIVCEVLAASAMALAVLIPVAVLAPGWVGHLLLHETMWVVRVAVIGIPGLAGLLIAAHLAHGWALDYGARRSGMRSATTRALRFGLYACGWDLVIGPIGAVIVGLKEGAGAVLSIAGAGLGLPGRSARAFLRGCYHLDGKSAARALRASYVAAAISTTIGALAVIAGIVMAIFSG
jgi:hypothetical protein